MTDDLTLLQDTSNYTVTLQTYLKYMQQLEPQRQWMKNKLGPRLSELFAVKKEIKILAVGTGSGEVDIDFLNEIVARGKEQHGEEFSVVYQVVEPMQSSIDVFSGNVSKNENFKKVTFKWFQGMFEDFLKEFSKSECEENKFDFVHFVRCFYHIHSVTGLDVTYEHFLAKNGIVAVVGENKDAFWPKQMNFLHAHGLKHECFVCSGPVSQAYFLPGWISQATEKGWKYETYTHKYNFDVTPMYDDTSNIGNYLLDFCFHDKNSRKSISKETLKEFFGKLDKEVKEEEVEENGVKVLKKYASCELGAIIITKQ